MANKGTQKGDCIECDNQSVKTKCYSVDIGAYEFNYCGEGHYWINIPQLSSTTTRGGDIDIIIKKNSGEPKKILPPWGPLFKDEPQVEIVADVEKSIEDCTHKIKKFNKSYSSVVMCNAKILNDNELLKNYFQLQKNVNELNQNFNTLYGEYFKNSRFKLK